MATEVGKGYVEVTPDFKNFGSDVGREMGAQQSAFSKFGAMAGAAFKVGAVAAIGGGALFVKSAIGAASDLNESLSKNQAVFRENAKGVEAWASGSAKAFGQSKQQALEAAGTYGNLFQAFGVGLKPATEMSTTLTGLASDLASFNNTSVDEAIEALRSGLSGETEPLKRYGVALSDVRIREEAVAQGLIKNTKDALSPAAKAQAIYALTLKDTALAQGDFARTSGGLANQQKILGAQFTDLKAKAGAVFLPIVVKIVSFLNNSAIPALEKVGKFAALAFDSIRDAFSGEGITSDGWVGVAERIGVAIRKVVDFVKDNWHFIPDLLGGAFTGLKAVWDAVAFPVFSAIVRALQAVVSFVRDQWPAVREVIGGVFRDVVNAGQAVVTFFVEIWPTIRDTAVGVFDTIVEAGQHLVDWARDIWPTAKQALVDGFNEVVGSGDNLVAWFQTRWQEIQTAVKVVADFFSNEVWQSMQSTWDKILEGAQGVVNWFKTNWKAIGDSFRDVVTIVTQVGKIIAVLLGVIVAGWILVWRLFGDDLIRYAKSAWDAISQIIAGAVTIIRGILSLLAAILTLDWAKMWEAVKQIVDGVWQIINGIIDLAISRIVLALGMMVEVVTTLFSLAWETAKTVVSAGIDAIIGFVTALPGRVVGAISSLAQLQAEVFRLAWEAAKTAMSTVVTTIISFVKEIPGRIVSALGNLLSLLVSAGGDVMTGLKNGIANGFFFVVGEIVKIPGKIVNALGSVGDLLYDAGKAVIGGLARGIASAVGGVLKSTVGGIASQIASWKGPLDYDRKVLVPNGIALMDGLRAGILKGLGPVQSTLSGFTANLSGGTVHHAIAASGNLGTVQPITIVNQGTFLGTEEAFGKLADRAIAQARRAGNRAA